MDRSIDGVDDPTLGGGTAGQTKRRYVYVYVYIDRWIDRCIDR